MFRDQKVIVAMPAYNAAKTLQQTHAEVSCPTKYFPEASSINLPHSIQYAYGCLSTALTCRLAKMKLISSRLFPHTQ
jgi:hypothetical protein